MTARQEILQAVNRITARTGRETFSPQEVLDDLRRHRPELTYADSTIRTHIVAAMCVNAPDNHAVKYPDLLRVDRAVYRLFRLGDSDEPVEATPRQKQGRRRLEGGRITEDQVKQAVKDHLEADGWQVEVAWGRQRGIDIEATHRDERLVIEAKAEVKLQPQQVNHFLGALGELIQRMDDPEATYGLALPDNRQYRGLVGRLPEYAVERLGLVVFWVGSDGSVEIETGT